MAPASSQGSDVSLQWQSESRHSLLNGSSTIPLCTLFVREMTFPGRSSPLVSHLGNCGAVQVPLHDGTFAVASGHSPASAVCRGFP